MTVYRLSYDSYSFPRIDISEDELEQKLPNGRKDLSIGVSRKAIWNDEISGKYYFDPDNPHPKPCPDIAEYGGCELVFSQSAKDKLESVLSKYGEFLAINVEDKKHYLFNLLNFTDAIDPFNSKKEIFDGIEVGVEKISFLENEVSDLCIFSTPYDGYSYLYCTNEFKTLIENSGLTSGWRYCKELREKARL